MTYSIEEIAGIIGGKIICNPNPDAVLKDIANDSRQITDGRETLFFALKGPRNDGHRYLPALAGQGVGAIVISQAPDDLAIFRSSALILVKDTLAALHKLASFHRHRFTFPVIGVTGSNGKTIIKEWLFELLNHHFSIIRSPKSYNSQIGVPLSVWLMNPAHSLAIIEAGISEPGEMENLEKIISPEIGILANIGSAHQEHFIDARQKTIEKLSLFKNSKKLVFSADQGETTALAEQFCNSQRVQKINWSLAGNPSLIRFDSEERPFSTQISAQTPSGNFSFEIPFTEWSAIENACHCFAATYALGVNPDEITGRFANLQPVAMRLEFKQGKNRNILINDYYNSDINALSIALSALSNQALKGRLQKVLILSDIKQTGIPSAELYSMVAEMVAKSGINRLVGIGPDISENQHLFSLEKNFYIDTKHFLDEFLFEKIQNSAILLKGARDFQFEKISSVLQEKAHQTILETDLNAMVDNLNTYRSLLKSGTRVMAMVKAFSYGSGTTEIATLLQFHGISYLAVAVADEGLELRAAGITTPILVMNPEAGSFQNMIDHNLEPNIYSFDLLKDFAATARYNAVIDYPVHIKIDTGMNRLGFKESDNLMKAAEFIHTSGNLKACTVFSHLAGADEPDLDAFTFEQLEKFESFSHDFISQFDYPILRHILNSAGIERFATYQFDMVRLGIGLYGVSAAGLPLKNISTLKTTVSQVKEVADTETVGYSRKGKINQPSKIAVIPIGYADGLRRSLGNLNGRVFVNGAYAPFIGNICMDMAMVDVTGLDAHPGDSVEIFGPHIPVTELAEKTGTIAYEILTGISQRVKRVYLQE
jgi:alanine racemase